MLFQLPNETWVNVFHVAGLYAEEQGAAWIVRVQLFGGDRSNCVLLTADSGTAAKRLRNSLAEQINGLVGKIIAQLSRGH